MTFSSWNSVIVKGSQLALDKTIAALLLFTLLVQKYNRDVMLTARLCNCTKRSYHYSNKMSART